MGMKPRRPTPGVELAPAQVTAGAGGLPALRRPAVPVGKAAVLVVTPWYPTSANPYSGAFVRESVRALVEQVGPVTIVHVENRPVGDSRRPTWTDTPEGRLRWIPVPMETNTSRGRMMLAQRRALRRHAGRLLTSAPVVHCHVGAPTAAGLAPLLPHQTRLVVTEHAGYLPSVFRDPLARSLYRDALRRAEVFTTVSPVTAERIEAAYPDERGVSILPNPLEMSRLPTRTTLSPGLPRWLYVGNLIPAKGVRRLIRAFARWVPEATVPVSLTLAGDGPCRAELADLAEDLGVTERVRFLGPVPPEQMGEVYAGHDLLVHLSEAETFGLSCVEAAAAGLCVVVTDCGGPTDTLVVHEQLGLARVIPVDGEEQTTQVVEAVRTLSATPADIQADQDTAQADQAHRVAASRAHLERCYGARAVGTRLARLLRVEPLPSQSGSLDPTALTSDPGPGLRALAVAVTPGQLRRAEAWIADVADFGGTGLLLTASPPRHQIPDGFEVCALGDELRRPRYDRWVHHMVTTTPGRALDGADRIARIAGSRSTRVTLGLGRRVQRVRAAQTRLARTIGDGPTERALRAGRWYAAHARLLEHDLIGTDHTRTDHKRPDHTGPDHTGPDHSDRTSHRDLDLSTFDVALVPADLLTRRTKQILQAHPDLEVRSDWTRGDVARTWARRLDL